MFANSLIDLQNVSTDFLAHLFSLSEKLSQQKNSDRQLVEQRRGMTVALTFFESSTRTRMSFETACIREGVWPLLLDSKGGTSLDKGETHEDTLLNILAMGPQLLVVRCGDDFDLGRFAQTCSTPILNAGWGRRGHPTQALLDAATWLGHRPDLSGAKLLVVGDIRHSRVVASHLELSRQLGYEIAFCGHEEFLPESTQQKVFSKLEDGLQWADAVMALRFQMERHQNRHFENDFRRFSLTVENLKMLKSDALIFHPGPINHGIELTAEVLKDPRAVVLEQVRRGVWIRQALVRMILEGETVS